MAMAWRGWISFQPPTKVAKHSSWFSPGASWPKAPCRAELSMAEPIEGHYRIVAKAILEGRVCRSLVLG